MTSLTFTKRGSFSGSYPKTNILYSFQAINREFLEVTISAMLKGHGLYIDSCWDFCKVTL